MEGCTQVVEEECRKVEVVECKMAGVMGEVCSSAEEPSGLGQHMVRRLSRGHHHFLSPEHQARRCHWHQDLGCLGYRHCHHHCLCCLECHRHQCLYLCCLSYSSCHHPFCHLSCHHHRHQTLSSRRQKGHESPWAQAFRSGR